MNFLTVSENHHPLLFAKVSDTISDYYLREDFFSLTLILVVVRERECIFLQIMN